MYTDPMNDVPMLTTILPIFAVIGIGYFAVKTRYIDAQAIPHMGRFVISVCLPALVFSAVASSPLQTLVNPSYVIVYAIAGVLSFFIGWGVSRGLGRHDRVDQGLTGAGMSISNSAFIGAPVLIAIYGELPADAFTMNVMVENIVVLPLILLMLELGRASVTATSGRAIARNVGYGLVTNPILLAVAAGVAFNLSGFGLPEPAERGIGFLANAAAGVALFVIGGSLVGTQVKGDLWLIGGVAAGKLIVHPLLVLGLITLMPAFDPELQRIAVLSAAVPMLSIYPVLAMRYRDSDASLYSAILVVTTLSSLVTLSVWMTVLY